MSTNLNRNIINFSPYLVIFLKICTLDEKIAVENTTIPEHLEQMIEVLKIEEQENGTGSAVSISQENYQYSFSILLEPLLKLI